MRLIAKALLAGIGSLAFAGTALAAKQDHVLNVALPDGSIGQLHYSGEAPPQVMLVPVDLAPVAWADPFADFDRIMAEMDRKMDAMLQQAATLARQAPSTNVERVAAGAQPLPAGGSYYSFVSNGGGAGYCSRSIQITTSGAGQPPKVVEQTSGDCGAAPAAPAAPAPGAEAAPQPSAAPAIDPRDRT